MSVTVTNIISVAIGAITIVLLLFVLYLLRSVYALVKRQKQAAGQSEHAESHPPPG